MIDPAGHFETPETSTDVHASGNDIEAEDNPSTCADCQHQKHGRLCARHQTEGWKPRNRAERRQMARQQPRSVKVGRRLMKRVEAAQRRQGR